MREFFSARSRGVLILALLLTAGGVFAKSLTYPLVNFDDPMNISNHPHYGVFSWETAKKHWTDFDQLSYVMPLTTGVWWALRRVSENPAYTDPLLDPPSHVRPLAFHLVNLAVHLVSVLVVFLILEHLLASRGVTRVLGGGAPPGSVFAAIGGAVFALHPLQVQPVVWPSGLKELLSVCFVLISLRQLLLFNGFGQKPHGMLRDFVLSAVCFGLACLSKPAALSMPLLFISVLSIAEGRIRRKFLFQLLPFALLALPFGLVTAMHQLPSPPTSLWARPLIALDAIAFYGRKFFFPVDLALNYGRTPTRVLGEAGTLALSSLSVIFFVALGLRWQILRPLLFALTIFAAALFPASGLIPFTMQRLSTVSDHYAYLPMLGVAFGVAWGAWVLHRGLDSLKLPGSFGFAARAGAVLLMIGMVAATSRQISLWENSLRLLDHSARVFPSPIILNNLCYAFWKSGRLDSAVEVARLVLSRGYRSSTNFLLANALFELGRYEEALEAAERTAKDYPGNVDVLRVLGLSYLRMKEFEKALPFLQQLVQGRPDSAEGYLHLGITYAGLKKRAPAAEALNQALRLDPELHPARQALDSLGQRDGASVPER